jgi:hypothetical protein
VHHHHHFHPSPECKLSAEKSDIDYEDLQAQAKALTSTSTVETYAEELYQGVYKNYLKQAGLDEMKRPFTSQEQYYKHVSKLTPKQRLHKHTPYAYTADQRFKVEVVSPWLGSALGGKSSKKPGKRIAVPGHSLDG